jgi:malonate transporter
MTALILTAFIPVFAIIALGYGVRASGYMPRGLWAGVNALNHRILLPAFLIALFARSDLTGADAPRLAAAATAAGLALIGVGVVTARLLKSSSGETAALTAVVVQWNVVLTLVLAERLLGANAAEPAAAVIAAGVVVGAATAVASFALAGSGSLTQAGRRIVLDPVILACAAGLIASFAGLGDRAPAIVGALELLGAGAMAVILMAMGAGLDFAALKGRLRLLAAAAALRCGLGATVFLGAAFALGLTGDAVVIMALAGAAPGAAFTYAVAADFKGETGLVAGMLTLSVLVSAVVLPLAAAFALSL